jgi:hypothetical protein
MRCVATVDTNDRDLVTSPGDNKGVWPRCMLSMPVSKVDVSGTNVSWLNSMRYSSSATISNRNK